MSEESDLDKQFERIEKLATARGLPEVERSTSYGTPALKVRGKLMVRLRENNVLVLQCPAEHKALLMEISPEIYFETAHYVGYGAVLIRLDKIADEELSIQLENCWRHRAPKSLSNKRPTEQAKVN